MKAKADSRRSIKLINLEQDQLGKKKRHELPINIKSEEEVTSLQTLQIFKR